MDEKNIKTTIKTILPHQLDIYDTINMFSGNAYYIKERSNKDGIELGLAKIVDIDSAKSMEFLNKLKKGIYMYATDSDDYVYIKDDLVTVKSNSGELVRSLGIKYSKDLNVGVYDTGISMIKEVLFELLTNPYNTKGSITSKYCIDEHIGLGNVKPKSYLVITSSHAVMSISFTGKTTVFKSTGIIKDAKEIVEEIKEYYLTNKEEIIKRYNGKIKGYKENAKEREHVPVSEYALLGHDYHRSCGTVFGAIVGTHPDPARNIVYKGKDSTLNIQCSKDTHPKPYMKANKYDPSVPLVPCCGKLVKNKSNIDYTKLQQRYNNNEMTYNEYIKEAKSLIEHYSKTKSSYVKKTISSALKVGQTGKISILSLRNTPFTRVGQKAYTNLEQYRNLCAQELMASGMFNESVTDSKDLMLYRRAVEEIEDANVLIFSSIEPFELLLPKYLYCYFPGPNRKKKILLYKNTSGSKISYDKITDIDPIMLNRLYESWIANFKYIVTFIPESIRVPPNCEQQILDSSGHLRAVFVDSELIEFDIPLAPLGIPIYQSVTDRIQNAKKIGSMLNTLGVWLSQKFNADLDSLFVIIPDFVYPNYKSIPAVITDKCSLLQKNDKELRLIVRSEAARENIKYYIKLYQSTYNIPITKFTDRYISPEDFNGMTFNNNDSYELFINSSKASSYVFQQFQGTKVLPNMVYNYIDGLKLIQPCSESEMSEIQQVWEESGINKGTESINNSSRVELNIPDYYIISSSMSSSNSNSMTIKKKSVKGNTISSVPKSKVKSKSTSPEDRVITPKVEQVIDQTDTMMELDDI